MAAFLVRALGLTDDGDGDLFIDDDGSIFEGDIDRLGTAGDYKGLQSSDEQPLLPGQRRDPGPDGGVPPEGHRMRQHGWSSSVNPGGLDRGCDSLAGTGFRIPLGCRDRGEA